MYEISAQTYNFDFLEQIYPRTVFPVDNEKSENHHIILHIRISLGIKFHFEKTTLNSGTNLTKNGISGQKEKK